MASNAQKLDAILSLEPLQRAFFRAMDTHEAMKAIASLEIAAGSHMKATPILWALLSAKMACSMRDYYFKTSKQPPPNKILSLVLYNPTTIKQELCRLESRDLKVVSRILGLKLSGGKPALKVNITYNDSGPRYLSS